MKLEWIKVPVKFKAKVLGYSIPGGKKGISGNNSLVTGLVKNYNIKNLFILLDCNFFLRQ